MQLAELALLQDEAEDPSNSGEVFLEAFDVRQSLRGVGDDDLGEVSLETLASDFMRRSSLRSSEANAVSDISSLPSAPGPLLLSDSRLESDVNGVGQAAWCTDPSIHQDHTSSVAKGMNGARSRCRTQAAAAKAFAADSAPGPSP